MIEAVKRATAVLELESRDIKLKLAKVEVKNSCDVEACFEIEWPGHGPASPASEEVTTTLPAFEADKLKLAEDRRAKFEREGCLHKCFRRCGCCYCGAEDPTWKPFPAEYYSDSPGSQKIQR
jgi:hypothetical protein